MLNLQNSEALIACLKDDILSSSSALPESKKYESHPVKKAEEFFSRNKARFEKGVNLMGFPCHAYSSCKFIFDSPKFEQKYKMLSFIPKNKLKAWSQNERRIFLQQHLAHPKKFHKISNHLPFRTTGECVEYYYLKKHDTNLKQKALSRSIYTPPLQKYKDAYSNQTDINMI